MKRAIAFLILFCLVGCSTPAKAPAPPHYAKLKYLLSGARQDYIETKKNPAVCKEKADDAWKAFENSVKSESSDRKALVAAPSAQTVKAFNTLHKSLYALRHQAEHKLDSHKNQR